MAFTEQEFWLGALVAAGALVVGLGIVGYAATHAMSWFARVLGSLAGLGG